MRVSFFHVRRFLFVVLAPLLFTFPAYAPAAPFDASIVERDAEISLRTFMERWAYDQHWMMWEMGNEASRIAWSQNEFADRIRRTGIKPAAGKQDEEIRVYPKSEYHAEIFVKFSLENHPLNRIRTFTMTVPTVVQDGRWRFQLGDFLQLLDSGYWY